MDSVVIYGAGGLGCQVHDILQQAGRYEPVGYLDSNVAKHGRVVGGLVILGGLEQVPALLERDVRRVVVAVGNNRARAALAEALVGQGLELVSAIHPLANISPSSEIATHVIIGPRATVCVHTRIGPHTVLSAGVIADHDNAIGAGVFLGPAVRLAGEVTIEDFAYLGIGAAVIPGGRVGRAAQVAAGTVVIRDVPPNGMVNGVPGAGESDARSRFVPESARADREELCDAWD